MLSIVSMSGIKVTSMKEAATTMSAQNDAVAATLTYIGKREQLRVHQSLIPVLQALVCN